MTHSVKHSSEELFALLSRESDRLRIDLNDPQKHLLLEFDALLERWNRKINLTAMRTPKERVLWMYGESLWGARRVKSVGGVVDLGSGCGFPGLAFAILDPQRSVTLVESRARKVHFLKTVARQLSLKNVTVREERVEQLLDRQDLVLENLSWRALTLGEKLLRNLLYCLEPGGSFIFWGTEKSEDTGYLQDLPDCRQVFREVLPGSGGRFIVQVVKGST